MCELTFANRKLYIPASKARQNQTRRRRKIAYCASVYVLDLLVVFSPLTDRGGFY